MYRNQVAIVAQIDGDNADLVIFGRHGQRLEHDVPLSALEPVVTWTPTPSPDSVRVRRERTKPIVIQEPVGDGAA